MKKQKKKKFSVGRLIQWILSFSIGAAAGFISMEYIVFPDDMNSFPDSLCKIAFALVIIIIGTYFQLIVHEAGHLVFGLLSGYKFRSFRIFSLTWIKNNGKIRFKKYSLAGTGGQCLMSPPDMKDGRFTVIAYNLGGVLMNIIASALFLVLYLLLKSFNILSSLMLIISVIGFFTALINGVPMTMGTINNDGHNAFSISRNKTSMKAFWLQLKIHDAQADGMRLKDMPEEWFEYPQPEQLSNSMVAAVAVFCCNRMMDAHDFKNANTAMTELIESDSALIEIHRQLLVCDKIYCELLKGNNDEAVYLMNKKQIKLMKAMKDFPSVMRTEYAYLLLCKKDTASAQKIKSRFEKRIASYPYSGEAQTEQELMEIADNLANN
ncbi:MAG: hypothetical protein IJX24_02310 [Oscillospiraceae bacterium]|nr:hypothetical protein [Oscillospiraceae bacterium]